MQGSSPGMTMNWLIPEPFDERVEAETEGNHGGNFR
jgi:hypothetical protein